MNERLGRIDIYTYPLSWTPSPLRLASSAASLQSSRISSILRLISSIISLLICRTCVYNTYYVNYVILPYLITGYIVTLIIGIITHRTWVLCQLRFYGVIEILLCQPPAELPCGEFHLRYNAKSFVKRQFGRDAQGQ